MERGERNKRRGEKIILSVVRKLAIEKKRATLSDPEIRKSKIKQAYPSGLLHKKQH